MSTLVDMTLGDLEQVHYTDEPQEQESALAIVMRAFPKCKGCGASYQAKDEREAAQLLRIDREIEAKSPAIHKSIHDLSYLCEDCEDAFLRRKKEGRDKAVARSARSTVYNMRWLPEMARDCTFKASKDEIENRNAHNAKGWKWARDWPDVYNPNAYIQGTRGTGKTFMAYCICNKAISAGKLAYEVQADEIRQAAYAGYEQQKDAEKLFKRCKDIDVLLIEEISIPQWSEKSINALRSIIDHRYKYKLPTFITSNVSWAEMRERWLNAYKENPVVVESMTDRMRDYEMVTLLGDTLRDPKNQVGQ